jgi:hypothetical protein
MEFLWQTTDGIRGYERDGETENLAKVRPPALTPAQNPATPLPVRVTALRSRLKNQKFARFV